MFRSPVLIGRIKLTRFDRRDHTATASAAGRVRAFWLGRGRHVGNPAAAWKSWAAWRKGWDSNPRGACTPGGFQDRCLKPLGHPSSLATSTTDAALADKSRHCRRIAPPTPVRGAVGWPGLILNKWRVLRGERRRSGAGRLSGAGPALALPDQNRGLQNAAAKKKTPRGCGASPRFGVCQDSSGIGGI